MIKSILVLTILVFVVACNNEPKPSKVDKDTILVTLGAEQITVEDLEQHLLNLPVSQRWSDDDQLIKLSEILKKLAVHKLLINEAKFIGADRDNELENLNRIIQRDLYTNQYLQSKNTQKQMTEETLKTYFDDNKDKFDLPETRHVLHIFKGLSDNSYNEILDLQKRVLNGENFKLLAKAHSESESRHRSGSLGMVKRGDFSEDFDKVIFNLEKNTPSEVIKTADGHHIFWISDILVAKKYKFEEVKNNISSSVMTQLMQETVINLAKGLESPNPKKIMPTNDIIKVLRSQRPNQEIISLGDFSYSAKQLMNDLTQITQPSSNDIAKNIGGFIDLLVAKETIYQHMISNQIEFENKRLLEYLTNLNLVESFSQIKMVKIINNHPEWINQFYQNNLKRYSTPVKIEVQRLVLPNQRKSNQLRELELKIKELDAKNLSLEDLAKSYRGQIQNIPSTPVSQLQKLNSRLVQFALLLEPGEHSPPYSNQQFIYIDKLISKADAKIQSLAVVRQKVVSDYIERNKGQLFQILSKELLEKISINESNLKAFIDLKT